MAIVILAGPSAIGKSYLAQALLTRYPRLFARVPVYTTRQPRPGDGETKDRLYVSRDIFTDMQRSGLFCVHEEFAGNLYGYHKTAFQKLDKHLLVDMPPYFLSDFLALPEIVVIGLQAGPGYGHWLDARMQARGDTPQVRAARKLFIERDIQDLHEMQTIIEQNGKLFYVTDDTTIPFKVIPWVEHRLGLVV